MTDKLTIELSDYETGEVVFLRQAWLGYFVGGTLFPTTWHFTRKAAFAKTVEHRDEMWEEL